jgi:RNA polymerase sigma-70 factor (ECF subfamily)
MNGGEMAVDRVQRVYNQSFRRLVGQLYGVCGDLAEAEDVVSEAFVRAVARSGTFDRLDNPEAWLRTVAVNLSRSRHRRRLLAERFGRHSTDGRPEQHPPDLSEERIALVSAMRALPSGQREALALHYLADLPVHEVARNLDVPVGTVKARLSRGRTALARLLDESRERTNEEVRHG